MALKMGGLALAAIAGALMASCAAQPAPQPPAPPPAAAPLAPIALPADNAAHDNRIEWWYYSGHLEAEADGEEPRQLGYHYALFRYMDAGGNASYAAHASLTDAHAELPRHYQGYSVEQPLTPERLRCNTGAPPLAGLQAGNWCLAIDGQGRHRLAGEFGGEDRFALDLGLREDGPAVLHNRTGVISYLGWSYYYSYPRMPTAGTLTLDGVEYSVEGTSWHDHQWGEFYLVGSPAGWQWFALTLDNGAALKITLARDTSGQPTLEYATLQDGDGRVTHIGADGIVLEELGSWTSPQTGAVYPSGWRASIAELDLELELRPLLEDQENDGVLPRAAIYWEGQLEVMGSMGGAPVAGQGYGELSGYAPPEPIEWRKKR